MFKGKIYVCGIVCCLLMLLSFWALRPTTATQEAYELLMNSSQQTALKQPSTQHLAQQKRFNVSKHILLKKKDQRLHARLCSATAELVLDQKEGKTEMIEYFKDMRCLMQEDLLITGETPTQMIRSIEADEGVYFYKTEELVAERVNLSRYLGEGHQLPQTISFLKLLMHGRAKHLKFSLVKGAYSFKAEGLQAIIQEGGEKTL